MTQTVVRLPIFWTSSVSMSSHVPAVSMAMGYVRQSCVVPLDELPTLEWTLCQRCVALRVWTCGILSQWFSFSPGKESGTICMFVVLQR